MTDIFLRDNDGLGAPKRPHEAVKIPWKIFSAQCGGIVGGVLILQRTARQWVTLVV
jgi:hypothetical protein